ncbi:hypothetical protein Bbelb_395590 [Branchiostoma belcheri]|nr:hypothetical protein Bbelb_395590 [Branchiostoma belcheri]
MRISFRGTFCEIPRYVLRNIAGRRAGDCGRTCVRLGDVPQNFAELSQNCPLVMGNATAKLLQQRKPEVNDLRQRVNKRGQTPTAGLRFGTGVCKKESGNSAP